MFDDLRVFAQTLGLPAGDLDDLPPSEQTFPDGAHYRLEVPTINTPEALQALLETAEQRYGVVINRVDETAGIFRLTAPHIREYVSIARAHGVELNLSIGPRATYDTSATRLSPEGVRISYRLRGMEQVLRAVEDVRRAVALGVRGILVYDEGVLWFLNALRQAGKLPSTLKFKLSAHCGHGNPVAFKLLEQLGADSINPVRDLTLPMIAALRAAVRVPLDVHTDNPPASGGFIRTYECPEMVRIGAPIHLKCGNSVVDAHGIPTSAADGQRMAAQAAIVQEFMNRYYPEARQSSRGAADLAVPEEPQSWEALPISPADLEMAQCVIGPRS